MRGDRWGIARAAPEPSGGEVPSPGEAMTVRGKNILLGVTGGVAAFKAVLLLRLLTRAGAEVRVVLTPSAARFIPALTFEALSGQPVEVDLWASTSGGGERHIQLAQWADLIVVAPATVNFLAEQAHGLCRDLLGVVCMASAAPQLIAPAMHENMWRKPSTQRVIAQLATDGVHQVGPVEGDLATGSGEGRMAEPEVILEAIEAALSPRDLVGRRVLVSAGPTREALDPVRFISNHSSGRMGYAIARAARQRGAAVTLVSGPSALPVPLGVERIPVESAAQMRDALVAAFPGCDAVIMAAAVADYRPAQIAPHKIKKGEGPASLELERTADILAELGRTRAQQVLVGFAMETRDLVASARRKLSAKGCDLIVANHLLDEGAGFGVETNRVTLVSRSGETPLPLLSKLEVAERILDEVKALWEGRHVP